MNFIDSILENKEKLSGDDFLQALAGIYDRPEVRKILHKYPKYIQDIINIIDYDTELQMEGLTGVLEDLEEKHDDIYNALLNCGAVKEADILKRAKELDCKADTYDMQISELSSETSLYNDYESFWDLVRTYIENNK